MSALDDARQFVALNYPKAAAAILGGSAATGQATPTSDLDILIVLADDTSPTSYAETTSFNGWIVEAFVHTPSATRRWMQLEKDQRRPVLATIIATGISLAPSLATTELVEEARAILENGPDPLTREDRDLRRYSLSASLDDLEGSTQPAETYAIMASVFQEAADLTLLHNRHWTGRGKWLVRRLADYGGHAGSLFIWAQSENRSQVDLLTLGHAVLDEAGGYLQQGFLRGSR